MVNKKIYPNIMANKIILVDGSSYLFRAYYALPHLTNSTGTPSGAIIGVLNMLRKLKKTYNSKYICVIFDAKGKNFRHDLFPEYKANRKKVPNELVEQIKPLISIIKALGYKTISMSGVEADDVIGTLCKKLKTEYESDQIIIATGDKDMAQLVNLKVSLIDTMKDTLTDIEEVKKKFGVMPSQIIDYLALVGDTSDNIPGIPKVGPKTASKWLCEFQNIENLIQNAELIKGKVGENLRAHTQQLRLSYKLATINCDLDIPYNLTDLAMNMPNRDYLLEKFKFYEFKKLLSELKPDKQAPSHKKNYYYISTIEKLNSFIEVVSNKKIIAIDTETTSIDPMKANLVGISISYKAHMGVYIPLTHKCDNMIQQIPLDSAIEKLKLILEDNTIEKVGQNIKYDIKILNKVGIQIRGKLYDTMLASYVFNSSITKHNLNDLAKKYLDYECVKFEEITKKANKKITFDQVNINDATMYAAEDVDITFQLHNYFWPKISANNKLTNIFLNIEMPVMYVINQIEMNGIAINLDSLKKQSDEIEIKLDCLEQQCYTLSGAEFNLSSSKQMREILFEKLKLPILSKTPGGVPSTSEDVLKELSNNYELPKIIMEYRHLSKLKNTYIDKLPKMINPNTHRIHTSYHQAVAITGRLSSSDPNLQNIPIRTPEGKKIREAIVPRKGFSIISADYSQIELRIMAHISHDLTLINAFTNNEDIHASTASEILNKDIKLITSEERRQAKAVNFGLIYGMSAFGLAKQLQISRANAQNYIDIYFQRYPMILEYMEQKKKDAQSNGYVETIFGRRLHIPNIKSKNFAIRNASERISINAPMQGSAADIIKIAMIKINEFLEKNTDLHIEMVMQVHDELVFEVKNEHVKDAKYVIQNIMENATKLLVPLVVDINEGSNWAESH